MAILAILLSPPKPFLVQVWSVHTLIWAIVLIVLQSMIAYRKLGLSPKAIVVGVFLAKTVSLLVCIVFITRVFFVYKIELSSVIRTGYLIIVLNALIATIVERGIFACTWPSHAHGLLWKVAILANMASLIVIALDFFWRTTLFPPLDTL